MVWVDGKPVTYDEVGRYLRTKEPMVFASGVEGIVLERIARALAETHGVKIPTTALARETTRRVKEWEAYVKAQGRKETGKEVDPNAMLRQVAGLEPEEFRSHVRRHTELELLQNRLLRYEAITSPRVEVSILVVEEETAADDLTARIRGGAEFAALAREHSAHASAEAGGEIDFPLLREDINDDEVRRTLFAAEPGDLLGPFPVRAADQTYYQIYRLKERRPARSAAYSEVAEEISAGLEARPVSVSEYERWRRRVLMRHSYRAAPPQTAGRP